MTKGQKRTNFFGKSTGEPEEHPSERWQRIPPGLVHELIVRATAVGCAVLFGASRDGGVPGITFMKDNERESQFFRPGDDPEDYIRHMIDWFEGIKEEQNAPSNKPKGRG